MNFGGAVTPGQHKVGTGHSSCVVTAKSGEQIRRLDRGCAIVDPVGVARASALDLRIYTATTTSDVDASAAKCAPLTWGLVS